MSQTVDFVLVRVRAKLFSLNAIFLLLKRDCNYFFYWFFIPDFNFNKFKFKNDYLFYKKNIFIKKYNFTKSIIVNKSKNTSHIVNF